MWRGNQICRFRTSLKRLSISAVLMQMFKRGYFERARLTQLNLCKLGNQLWKMLNQNLKTVYKSTWFQSLRGIHNWLEFANKRS